MNATSEQVEENTEMEISISDMWADEEVAETEQTVEAVDSEKGEQVEAKPTEAVEEAKEPAESPSAATTGLQAALVAERQKRQRAEAELKGYQKPEVTPDPIEDPDGYKDYIIGKTDKGLLDAKIAISRDLILDSKEDYLEKEEVFMRDLVGAVIDEDGMLVSVSNQSMLDQFQKAANPAKFVYDQAVTYLDVKEKSSPDYAEKLKASLKAEILAELQAETAPAKPKTVGAADVPNLTSTSAGSNATAVVKPLSHSEMWDDDAV